MANSVWNAADALRHVLVPRGARIYGVGAAKTGTHSVARMFSDRVRAAHEIQASRLIQAILEAEQKGDRGPIRRQLRMRDALHRLKIDASQINVYLIDDLLALYPDSRFVLTIRPPMSWLRSIIDDSLRRDVSDTWMRFREFRFGRSEPFPSEEAALEDLGIFQLRGYLSYWRDAIERVEAKVPPEQLLMVQVNDLERRASEIAAFCGIPDRPLRPGRAHAFANPQRFHVLSQVPEEHLLAVAEEECGTLMRRHFPERDLAEDVRTIRSKSQTPSQATAAN